MPTEEEQKDNIVEIPAVEKTPVVTSKEKDFHQEPTKKQQLYFKYRGEGMNKKAAALKAGYSPSVAKSVKPKIEQSEGFRQLLDKEIPDDLLVAQHKKLITQDEDKTVKGKMIVEANKLKGNYPKGEIDVDAPNVILHFNKQGE